MKDPARFALAIAAILTATALDAEQSSSREVRHASGAATLAVRSGATDPARAPPSFADSDGFAAEPERTRMSR